MAQQKNTSSKSSSSNATPTKANKSSDAGQDQVQENFDEAAEKGYFGEGADPTPDEHYTIGGVLAGKPTPENPEGLAPDEHPKD